MKSTSNTLKHEWIRNKKKRQQERDGMSDKVELNDLVILIKY